MKQHTLKKSISTAGLGLHSGERVNLSMHPAPIDHGIVFVRSDLAHRPILKLGDARVCDTTLCTGVEQHGARVRTIEHLLAALSSVGLDNVVIELDAEEVPILDGSAAPWLHLLVESGLLEQDAWRTVFQVMKPYTREHNGSWLRISPEHSFRRRVEIDFDHPTIDKTPTVAETHGDADHFMEHTGRARTFGFLHQVEELHARGLAQGGSLNNAMVLDEHRLINEDGLRMSDEFAQHKLLDLMGDLLILGAPLLGFVEAYRPGHAMQAAFTQSVRDVPGVLRLIRLGDRGVLPAPGREQPSFGRDISWIAG